MFGFSTHALTTSRAQSHLLDVGTTTTTGLLPSSQTYGDSPDTAVCESSRAPCGHSGRWLGTKEQDLDTCWDEMWGIPPERRQ